MIQRISVSFLFIFLCNTAIGQIRQLQKLLRIDTSYTVIDSAILLPASLRINDIQGNTVDLAKYNFNYSTNTLHWLDNFPTLIQVKYSTIPLKKSYYRKDRSIIEPESMSARNPFSFASGYKPKEEPLSLGSLSKSGSISRGISVGNNQNLTVNSNLNLQLNGKITDDIELIASISDENIPIQPEGNTQQLQDFDNVFIQLRNQKNSLIAGDFELRKPNSYFLNFYKRTKGAYYTGTFLDSMQQSTTVGVAGAVAKGKYTRNTFMGQEGNQGPYRLKGDNGEFFVIILSGTERVYVDGQLLKRGQDNDYTIDYNTAEITFTTRKLITQYNRIIIEFEYSDKNYARSLVYTHATTTKGPFQVRFNFYNEQDSKNQPLLQQLSPDQQRVLANAGDNVSSAIYPAIDTVAFSPEQVLYKQVDTLGFSNVYVYSTNADSARYRLGFSLVGQGRGNYVLVTAATANGRVYKWVAPQNGLLRGEYEPVTLLIAPKRNQFYTLASTYSLAKNTSIETEIALSNTDINTFAAVGDDNNVGLAQKTGIKNILSLGGKTSDWKLASTASYEYNQKRFRPIERFRAQEFDREYNTAAIDTVDQHLLSGALELSKNQQFSLRYGYNTVLKKTVYRGNKQELGLLATLQKYKLIYQGSLLNANATTTGTRFNKQRADLSRNMKYLKVGIVGGLEQINIKNTLSDTLLPNSFYFKEAQVYAQNADTSVNKYRVDYTKRFDYSPLKSTYTELTDADIINTDAAWMKNPKSILRTGGTYRRLQTKGASTNSLNTLLARLGYDYVALKGLFNGTTYYEIGTGQEPKRAVSYVKVDNGQGVYTWNDYNENGIEELNEFEEAQFRDKANYIRVFTPTNQFIRSNSTQLSAQLNITPSNIVKGATRLGKLVNRFSTQSAYTTQQKIVSPRNGILFNPFENAVADSQVLSVSNNTRNTLFFNKFNPFFGASYSLQTAKSKLLLINGFDTRQLTEHNAQTRWIPVKPVLWIQDITFGNKLYQSAVGQNQNYQITFTRVKPEFTITLQSRYRLVLYYQYGYEQNTTGIERLSSQQTGTELRYNLVSKGTISAAVNYIKNVYQGLANTPVGYEMLQGLQPGNNLTWNVVIQRNLAENLQLNLNYDGRKSEKTPTVHTGTVQVRAFF